MTIEQLKAKFVELYGEANVNGYLSPGRVNLTGEHILRFMKGIEIRSFLILLVCTLRFQAVTYAQLPGLPENPPRYKVQTSGSLTGIYERPIYEAEDTHLNGAVFGSHFPGYSGNGYAVFKDTTVNSLEQQVIMPLAGTYVLECRYANGNSLVSTLKMEVNGTFVKNIEFSPTGSWYSWGVSRTEIVLAAEKNTIRLTGGETPGLIVDKLDVAYKFQGQSACDLITELPDPFKMYNGSRIPRIEEWEKQRHYIKEMLQFYLYGKIPLPPKKIISAIVPGSEKTYITANGTKAVEKAVKISFNDFSFNTHVYHPVSGKAISPVVVFISWSFDPVKGKGNFSVDNLEKMLDRGYGVANFVLDDIVSQVNGDRSLKMYAKFPGYDFGAVAAWGYAASRVVDYLETQDWVDKGRIVVSGHSRTGKAALCAGIYDERISLVNPNGSGAGGAGCYRIRGDQYENLTGDVYPDGIEPLSIGGTSFLHWYTPRLAPFSNHETYLPFDLHFNKAACAPRALISTDALSDTWANPYGTQLTYQAAAEVYDYLGIKNKIACHYRSGIHNQTLEDITALLDFCDFQFFGTNPQQDLTNIPRPKALKPYSWGSPKSVKPHSAVIGSNSFPRSYITKTQ